MGHTRSTLLDTEPLHGRTEQCRSTHTASTASEQEPISSSEDGFFHTKTVSERIYTGIAHAHYGAARAAASEAGAGISPRYVTRYSSKVNRSSLVSGSLPYKSTRDGEGGREGEREGMVDSESYAAQERELQKRLPNVSREVIRHFLVQVRERERALCGS